MTRHAVAAAGEPEAPHGRLAEFARLLELTQALRTSVEGDDWARAAELEHERRGLVERVFDARPSAEELGPLVATLREVVRLNDELIGLAEHRRRGVERDVDTVVRGRSAMLAYAAVAGPGDDAA